MMQRASRLGIRPIIAAGHDSFMAAASFVLALYLRLGGDDFSQAAPYLLPGTLLFTAICLGVFISMRLYRGLWRYASLPDMVALVKAVSIAIGAFAVLTFGFTQLEGIPRSLPLINWLLLLAMLGGPRFFYRAMKDRTLRFDFRHDASRQIPLLLVGANDGAERFIRQCQRDPGSPYRVVGLLDDDPAKRNLTLHSIRIFGGTELLGVVMNKLTRKGLRPQRLLFTSDAPEVAARLLEESERLGLPLGRIPAFNAFTPGAGHKPEIRPVQIEDLLGRAQRVHDTGLMRALVQGKRVAVTGAGGSIGAELCRQLAELEPLELLLVEQGEFALYAIDLELAERAPGLRRHAVLGDVRRAEQVGALFARHRPQLVFHAAAIKHVPLAEDNPLAAIETNVLGTRNVAQAAQECGAEAMVLISTDKAVNPTSVMGATKRLAEAALHAFGQESGATRFASVRFGNVLASAGSVVPRFEQQLQRGGPLTVTHPDMVRYFMTIREAVELVIQAAALAAGQAQKSPVFVLDMGKPVRITDLAVQMIRLAGLKPGKDVEIVYTGLRPGEKLFEELFYDAEQVRRTEHAGILIAQGMGAPAAELKKSLEKLDDLCKQRSPEQALTLLRSLVPEFGPPNTLEKKAS